MSVDFYIPRNIPSEFEVYFTKSQSNDGKSGKVGILRLKLERDSDTEKTIIREQYSRVPLFAQRAMYLEESLPTMAYIFIMSASGGILQGDRYRIDITLSNNAFAHVTTQGATRIYKMQKNCGTQIVNIKVEEGSYFEYIPDQIIPFRNSRFYQEVELKVHNNATMIYSELIVPGRVASGEKFEYDVCYTKTIARNHLGKIRFIDTVKLEPMKQNLTVDGILGNYEVIGTIYIVTKEQYVKTLQDEINKKIKKFEDKVSGGTSVLSDRQGVITRILGTTAEDVKNLIFEVIGIARNQIIGAPFSAMRKA
jgi:urease accessory protein